MSPETKNTLARYRPYILPAGVVLLVCWLVIWASSSPLADSAVVTPDTVSHDVDTIVQQVDDHLGERWQNAQLDDKPEPIFPPPAADDLTVFRRLSLALHGTVPSLEDVRQFEADDKPKRLQRWTERLMSDGRFADYFSERLARAYVSTDPGTFVIYRRDRFRQWLRAQLKENRRYDAIVRDIISSDGLWTGQPATNFMTSAYNDGRFDVNKLTGRTVRAFLGQRIDCAQCHDSIFDDWKQSQFQGLAAFYAQSDLSVFGVEDKAEREGKTVEYMVMDGDDKDKKRVVKPAVPFGNEWLPEKGTRRQQLAAWITHPSNRRFERATVNRVWTLLFGRQYTYPKYAVDDLPDPDKADEKTDTKLLDIIGKDFREHDYDLRRLILVITSSRAFRMSSVLQDDIAIDEKNPQYEYELKSSLKRAEHYENNWGVFPLTQLRPEQVIGSMIQAASPKSIDQNSNFFVRFIRFVRENGFVEEYGDPGGDELTLQARTIPQSLLLMNGNLTKETTEASPFTSAGRIRLLAGTNRKAIEASFLVAFARRPSEEEMKNWLPRLDAAKNENERGRILEDLFWAMFNSPEFSFNH